MRFTYCKKSLIIALILLFITLQVYSQNIVDSKNNRPNILFCIADDASRAHMHAYGLTDWINTPGFDRVAKEGLLFMNTYTPNAKCSPSRAAILTGRNPWQLEEAANHNPFFPAKFTTVMEALAKHGYATGFTGKGWGPGNPGQVNGQRRELTGKGYSTIKMTAPTRGIFPVNYAANFEAFLNEKPSNQPFCFG
jgi:N-sulfoglucosamine sulfohydrolase